MKIVQNTSWGAPVLLDAVWMVFLYIALTLIIEVSIIYWLAKRKNYKHIDHLILAVICANAVSGLVGAILTVILF